MKTQRHNLFWNRSDNPEGQVLSGRILPPVPFWLHPKGLILCCNKKILWVESRDLSQTDNSYDSVFFPKVEWWVAEFLFLSFNNWGLEFLQVESSQSSQIYLSPEKLRKVFTF